MKAHTPTSCALLWALSLLTGAAFSQVCNMTPMTSVSGSNTSIHTALAWDRGGIREIFIGGHFMETGGITTGGIVRYDGQNLLPLGTGLTSFSADVKALAVFDDGGGEALYVGGCCLTLNGVTSTLAAWDGVDWSLPTPFPPTFVDDLIVHDDGSGPSLCVAGMAAFKAQVWTRSAAGWVRLGDLGATLGWQQSRIFTLKVLDTGSGPHLYAAGNATNFPNFTGFVAAWDGATWDLLPLLQISLVDPTYGLVTAGSVTGLETINVGNGPELYAAAVIQAGPYDALTRFDGIAWQPLPQHPAGPISPVSRMVKISAADGERLLLGMSIYSALPTPGLVQWDGTSWTSLMPSTDVLATVSNFAIVKQGTLAFLETTVGWADCPIALPGSVGLASGTHFAPLRISGSAAPFFQATSTPFCLELLPPPGLSSSQTFALAVLPKRPTPWTSADLGSGLGTIGFAPPGFPNADPSTQWLTSSLALLPSFFPATSVPWTLPNIVLPSGSTYTVQGFLEDPNAPLGIAVTNGIVIQRP